MTQRAFGHPDPLQDLRRVRTAQLLSDAANNTVPAGGLLENKIYLWPADTGQAITAYDATEAGLIAALAVAGAGDTVWLPSIPISITASATVPAGVTLKGISQGSILNLSAAAFLILSDGCSLERVIINQAANDATDMVAVQGPTTGAAYIVQSSITSTQAGAGDAVAISGSAGRVYVHDSYINGDSASGAGYGVQAAAGEIDLDDCWVLGSTKPLFGTGTVESYAVGDELGSGAITVTASAGETIGGLTIGAWYAIEAYNGPWISGAPGIGGPTSLNPPTDWCFKISNDGGASWSGQIGQGYSDDGVDSVYRSDIPVWVAHLEVVSTYYGRIFFRATTSSVIVIVGEVMLPGVWTDNSGTLSWRLYDATYTPGTTQNIITHGVRMGIVDGEPALSDRSAWDALQHPTIHANDIDEPDGIHHTLDALIASIGSSGGGSGLAGWLDPWLYRIAIDVANSDGTYTNKKVPVDVNTLPLVEASLCNSDLSDLRVTDSGGVSLLPFFRENDALLFNKSNFSRYASNPVIVSAAGAAWDHGWIHPQSIIDMQDGTYRMYYGGHPTPGDVNIPDKVGYATSSDGIAWTKYGSNPIFSPGTAGQWDDTRVEDFQVIREDATTWKAWYAGHTTGDHWQIGYATSSDGVSWTRYASNPVLALGAGGAWDSALVVPGAVWKEDSTYYMIYWGSDNATTQINWKVGLATSSDGITWTRSASNPVFSGGGISAWDCDILDMDVKKIGDTYFMFYQANVSGGLTSAIGLATSTDLIHWSRSSDNPWPRGTGSDWDNHWNEGPVLIRIGSTWNLYYMGKDLSTTKSIGLWQFPDTRLWPIIPSLTSAGTTLFVYYGNPAATDASTGSAGSPDGNITITNGAQDAGRLAAWDDESQPGAHARDIDDATYSAHLPPGGDNTTYLRGDRSWAAAPAPITHYEPVTFADEILIYNHDVVTIEVPN